MSTDGSEDWPGAWEFESRITDLEGIEVYVCIKVPRRATWRESGDLPPVMALGVTAYSAAQEAMASVADIKGRPPF